VLLDGGCGSVVRRLSARSHRARPLQGVGERASGGRARGGLCAVAGGNHARRGRRCHGGHGGRHARSGRARRRLHRRRAGRAKT